MSASTRHSIRDAEIKFGYSVTGIVDPARVLKNSGAHVGDKLIFASELRAPLVSEYGLSSFIAMILLVKLIVLIMHQPYICERI